MSRRRDNPNPPYSRETAEALMALSRPFWDLAVEAVAEQIREEERRTVPIKRVALTRRLESKEQPLPSNRNL